MRLSFALVVFICFICAAQADERREAAAQMLAVATFAADCPGVQPDYSMMRSSFEALGVEASDKDSKMVLHAMIIVANLNGNKEKNCEISWDQFGEIGKALPGLLRRK